MISSGISLAGATRVLRRSGTGGAGPVAGWCGRWEVRSALGFGAVGREGCGKGEEEGASLPGFGSDLQSPAKSVR